MKKIMIAMMMMVLTMGFMSSSASASEGRTDNGFTLAEPTQTTLPKGYAGKIRVTARVEPFQKVSIRVFNNSRTYSFEETTSVGQTGVLDASVTVPAMTEPGNYVIGVMSYGNFPSKVGRFVVTVDTVTDRQPCITSDEWASIGEQGAGGTKARAEKEWDTKGRVLNRFRDKDSDRWLIKRYTKCDGSSVVVTYMKPFNTQRFYIYQG